MTANTDRPDDPHYALEIAVCYHTAMREILLYSIAGVGSLVVLGYSVHMFVGGLVSPDTEATLIVAACLIGAAAIGAMAWDVIRRRRRP